MMGSSESSGRKNTYFFVLRPEIYSVSVAHMRPTRHPVITSSLIIMNVKIFLLIFINLTGGGSNQKFSSLKSRMREFLMQTARRVWCDALTEWWSSIENWSQKEGRRAQSKNYLGILWITKTTSGMTEASMISRLHSILIDQTPLSLAMAKVCLS